MYCPGANGSERLSQGLGSADLDHVIDAAGCFAHDTAPLGTLGVVQRSVRSELHGECEFFVIAARDRHVGAEGLRELQSEQRYAPGAQAQHLVSRAYLSQGHECAEGGQRRAGECRCFLIREPFGNGHQRRGRQHQVLGERSVTRSTQRGLEDVFWGITIAPERREQGAHTSSEGGFGYTASPRDDRAHGIRSHDQR